ncbi:MAG: hypothetical protein ACXWP5_05915 [Bdellovibrionota bacterium]
MKKLLALVVFAGLAVNPAFAGDIALDVAQAHLSTVSTNIQPLDLINWKVGDSQNFNISLSFLSGTMVKTVNKDEGTSLWIHEEINLGGANTVDTQINKADGKILKIIQNGQEQTIPDEKPEIIDQKYESVTVPAGTFKAIHITGKMKSVDHFEVWANPSATTMEGTLKQVMATQLGDMTMELTSFKKVQ